MVVLIAGACGAADPGPVDIAAVDSAVPTTPPVGLPLPPTPTPLGLPAVVVPIEPTAAPADEPAVEGSESSAPEPRDPEPAERVAVPTSQPDATAVPTQVHAALPTSTATPEPTSTPEPTVEPTPEPAPQSDARRVVETGYVSLGLTSRVSLVLPVARIELIGFHEAGHPGSQAINAAATGAEMITLESRGRGTDARSAADIVVPPGDVVVAPATGTVIAANEYVLYCEHQDQLVYIEPDGLPGWQVRVFHVEGSLPAVGTRVEAGVTRIADSARTLPFESQVDEFTGEPSWPHVHIEVVDTSVPDTRPPGPGCP